MTNTLPKLCLNTEEWVTFKQIIFQYLRTWLGAVQEAHGAGHCAMNTIPSFYPAPRAILRPPLIGVTAGKYLHLALCENKGLHYVFANQFTSCSLSKWFTRWCFSCQEGG